MKKQIAIALFIFFFAGSMAVTAQEKAQSNLVPQCKLITPNAFTPNDDGVNDFFRLAVSGTCETTGYNLKIFDRWGRLVFESADCNTEWDGTYDGQQLKEGVYLWQAAVRWASDQPSETKKGTLVLIR